MKKLNTFSKVIGVDKARLLGGACASTLVSVFNRERSGSYFSVKEDELDGNRKVALVILEHCGFLVLKSVAGRTGLKECRLTEKGKERGEKLSRAFARYLSRA